MKRVAANFSIAITFEAPRVNKFAALLANRTEFNVRPVWIESGFFLELTLRHREQIFARTRFAFRNRPMAFVFALEKRTAGMRDKYFELCVAKSNAVGAVAD